MKSIFEKVEHRDNNDIANKMKSPELIKEEINNYR